MFASHIVGGDLTYAYLGNNQYKFTLHLYRDCTSGTPMPSTANIYFFKTTGFTDANLGNAASPTSLSLNNTLGGTNETTVTPYYYSPCLTYPSGLCVAGAIFTGTATLPPIAGGYTIIYQNCCRNAGITNFTVNSGGGGGGGTGSTYKCILPGIGNSADSSPVFTQLPPTAICQNSLFSLNCGATDGDGDSLAYSLYTPFDGSQTTPSGYTPLSYVSPYLLANLLGGTPALSINTSTGLLTCNPPTTGRFLVGIRVDEYRNGTYIGSVYRDFQFNVTACTQTVTAKVPTNHSSGGASYILNCSNTTSVTFTNTSSPQNNLSTYYWDFGDTSKNDTSNLKAPTWVYHDTGTYTAQLVMNPTAYGSKCSDTAYVTVKVYHNANVDFYYIASPQTTCVPFIFRDTSTGAPAPLTYKWTFGDGGTSTLKDPVHVYLTGGTYTVTETIVTAAQCTKSVSKTIVISSAYPSAAILSSSLNCTTLNNTFVNVASAANYNWFFGDPSTFADTSHLATPTYTYPTPGVYSIELIVNKGFGGHCQDTAYQTFSVYPPFKVGYTYSPTSMWCVGMPIPFVDTSSGYVMPSIWNWDFGDGAFSTAQSPTHTYNMPGTYTVKLVAQNSKGCKDSLSITKTVYAKAIANIIAPTLNCYSNKVSFQTTGIAQKYFWNFGDTAVNDTSWQMNPVYNYLDTGVHQIKLVLNPGQTGTCTDSTTLAVKVYAPFGVGFTYTPPYICRRNIVHFIDTSTSIAKPLTWSWNLDDHNTLSVSQNPYHSYLDSGRFHIKLVIKNRVGCTDSVTKLIGVFAPPKATIGAPSLVCSGLTVGFQSLTYSGGYFWKFNDVKKAPNDTSWRFSPIYTYSDTGTFTAMFVVNPGAQDSCSDTTYATVKVFGPIVPKFGWVHVYNCPNHLIQFSDSSTSPVMPNQWLWNFGDSTTSVLKNPTHVYKKAGNYLVKLFIQDSKGCMDSVFHTIAVDTQTHSKFIVPPVNCDSIVHFLATSNTTKFYWNFGDVTSGAKNNDTLKSPRHVFNHTGAYTVTLIVYPNTGCADTSKQTINVEFGINAVFIPINSCVYDSATFFNNSVGGPAALKPSTWFFGDGDSLVSSSASVKHKYLSANTYNITLKVVNTWGCQDSAKSTVTIYPIPIINAGRDTSICNLDTISLEAYGGANYAWTPNYAIDDTSTAFPRVTPDVTTKYFVSVVTSDGCIAMDSVLIKNINPKSDGLIFDTTICYGDTVKLNARKTGGLKYLWTPAYALSYDTASIPLADPKVLSLYRIRILNGNCIRYDTIKVNVKILATPDAGNDATICNNTSVTLNATGGTYYSWKPTTNMLYSDKPNPVVSPKVTTKYFVTVVDTFVCLKPQTDSLMVYVDFFKGGEAQHDTNVVKNIPCTLSAWGGATYLWTPSKGLNDSSSANPICTLAHDQKYVVKITDPNGCYVYDTVMVYIFPAPIALMPNAFSPNGDGLDDLIKPIFAGIRELHHFNIYNRWGQLVFTTTDLNTGWDGTFNGAEQPMGTYMYMIDGIDVEGNGFNNKGDITLVR